jgi:hypothetical protein
VSDFSFLAQYLALAAFFLAAGTFGVALSRNEARRPCPARIRRLP